MTFDEMLDLWEEEGFIFAINSFTDRFKTSNDKRTLIETEPKFRGYESDVERVSLAALIEELCRLYSMTVPKWTEKTAYFLKIPYYAWDVTKPEHQEFLKEIAPPHFKKRGLMIPDNSFSRV